MVRPFLSDRFMTETIPTLRARGLETRIGIDGRFVSFQHKGGGMSACDVVIDWASREPQGSGDITVDVIGTEGTLSGRPDELVVDAGALFQLGGKPCEVTIGAKIVHGVAVASFRYSEGG